MSVIEDTLDEDMELNMMNIECVGQNTNNVIL